MSERKEYQLICSYVKHKYYVSTAYRKSSAVCHSDDFWYFETMVWEWDDKTKKNGEWLEQRGGALTEERALEIHFEEVEKLLDTPDKESE